MRSCALPLLAVWAAICGNPGCSSDADEGDPNSHPSDISVGGVSAFLEGLSYQEELWEAETATPRDASTTVSPHGRVRVWRNAILVASQSDGNGQLDGTPHEDGSMAVKELFDEADALVGRAAMLKIGGDFTEWVYFCDGEEAQCGAPSSSDPYYALGTGGPCAVCHGGVVFTGY